MADKKEVLIYGDRRPPIVFEPSENPKEERLQLLDTAKVTFSDLLGEEKGVDDLYLQTSDKWPGHNG